MRKQILYLDLPPFDFTEGPYSICFPAGKPKLTTKTAKAKSCKMKVAVSQLSCPTCSIFLGGFCGDVPPTQLQRISTAAMNHGQDNNLALEKQKIEEMKEAKGIKKGPWQIKYIRCIYIYIQKLQYLYIIIFPYGSHILEIILYTPKKSKQ